MKTEDTKIIYQNNNTTWHWRESGILSSNRSCGPPAMTSRAARNMATKTLRPRNRRGSKQDANNVNSTPTTDNRAAKDDKYVEDNKSSDPRYE